MQPGQFTWIRHILPFIEQQSASYDNVINLLTCPTDPRGTTAFYSPVDMHGYTSYLSVSGHEIRGNDGIMFLDSKISASMVSDGTSNTLLVAERPPLLLGTNWGWGWWDSWDLGDVAIGLKTTSFLGMTSCPSTMYFVDPAATAPIMVTTNGFTGGNGNNCDANHPWSFHIGGANFLYGDGSVRYHSYAASLLLPAMATRSGGESTQID